MESTGTSARIPLTIESYGDSAVMVEIASPDASFRRSAVQVLRDRVLERRPHAVLDIVSGLESLLVEFDALETTVENVEYGLGLLAELATPPSASRHATELEIPFIIDAETAPDLDEVAAELALTPEDLIARVERSTLTIALLAAAMAPMMAGLEVPAPVRRRARPRTDVAAGSIMIAGEHAIIQPFPGPSGWRVIGRTPLTIVDIARTAPVSFAPGDAVRLRRIDQAEATRLHGSFLDAPREDAG